MPNARFLRNMGVASILAGVVLLGLAHLFRLRPVRRAARKVM